MDSSPLYELKNVLQDGQRLMDWIRALSTERRFKLLREINQLEQKADSLSRIQYPDTTGQ